MSKMYAIFLMAVIVTGTLVMTVRAMPVTDSSSGFDTLAVSSKVSYESNDIIQKNKEALFSLEIGNIMMSVYIETPNRHTIITYEKDELMSTLEFIVSPVEEKYTTVTILNNMIVSTAICEINILAPLQVGEPKQIGEPFIQYSLASYPENSGITAQYTYSWWDGVRQVTGPSYLIKYHHPDRTYYQIATWLDWTKFGNAASHNQINYNTAALLIVGGWAAVFGAIGAAATAGGGPGSAAAGAFLGALFGAIFGLITQATLGDEASCIWWWWGITFGNWFAANAWWLLTSIFGIPIAAGVFLQQGYLRIGDHTFVDAIGIGNP